jgi:hypothetical protein
MIGIGRARQLNATGDIQAAQEVILQAVILTPAAAASSAAIREGGSGGTVVLTLNAVANGASVWCQIPFAIRAPHLTLSGAGALVTVLL